jgi:hypothetical protein
LVSPICDGICNQIGSTSVLCGFASGIAKALIGCSGIFAQDAGATIHSVILAVMAHLYGYNAANGCNIFTT